GGGIGRWELGGGPRQPALASDLNADLSGEGRGWPEISGRARLGLGASRLRGQAIERGDLVLDYARRRASLAGAVETSAGRLSVDASGRPPDRTPKLQVRALGLAAL